MRRWAMLLAVALAAGCGKSPEPPAAKSPTPRVPPPEKKVVSPFERFEKKYVRITFKDSLSVEVHLARVEPGLLYVEADSDRFCVKPDVVARIEPLDPQP